MTPRCPYCGSKSCVNEAAYRLFVRATRKLPAAWFGERDDVDEDPMLRPSFGDVGYCEKTGKHVWACPFCHTVIPEQEVDSYKARCPECGTEANVAPSRRKIVC